MVAQQAQATGTLGGTPVTNLLVYVLDRGLSGTLVVEDHRSRKSAILFRRGVPAKVKLPEDVAWLSTVLVESGTVQAPDAERTFAAAQSEKKLHGQVLVAEGLVDPGALGDALAEQVARKIEWLCELRPESLWGYYDGQDFLQAYGDEFGAAADPLDLIWRVVRRQADPPVMDATLGRLGTQPLRLHPRSRPGRFGFSARERGALDVIRAKPQSVAELLASGVLPAVNLKRVLFALAITRHLDLGASAPPMAVAVSGEEASPVSKPPSVPARATSGVPPRPTSIPARPTAAASVVPAKRTGPAPAPAAEIEAFRKDIEQRSVKVGGQNYYQILGVEQGVPTSAIQTAFFQLAKRWHPDRIPQELTDVKELATKVFARMSEAHQVLTNEEQREEYERLMREGGAAPDEQEMVQRVLRAATMFQKAEVFARKGNLDEAEKLAALAAENDPEQAEYAALHADILSMRPDRVQLGYQDLIKVVNQAKKKEPDNMKVRLYRARVLKRAGEHDLAFREFRTIAENDAQNVEAAREVRLHEMRKGKRTTDPKKSGQVSKGTPSDIGQLFGKFFKR